MCPPDGEQGDPKRKNRNAGATGASDANKEGPLSATLSITPALHAVLVFVEDDALRAEVESILARDGYAVRGTRDEGELCAALHASSASVVVVDVSSVAEETLDALSSEGRVPRVVVFSSMRGITTSILPFRADVLRAAVSRAWRA
jgi:DNA-binding NtrC family response regulator